MFESLRLPVPARDLALAFDGGTIRGEATLSLLSLASALADLRAVPPIRHGTAARAALQAAIRAESARRQANTGVAVRARGAVVAVAAVAGAGLLVASAASGSNPVETVRAAVAAIPYVPQAPTESPLPMTLDGTITSPPSAGAFSIAASEGSQRVRITASTSIRDSGGAPLDRAALRVGTVVRVSAARRDATITASNVVVLSGPATDTPTAAPTTAAENTPASRSAAITTPAAVAASSREVTPAATPRPALASVRPAATPTSVPSSPNATATQATIVAVTGRTTFPTATPTAIRTAVPPSTVKLEPTAAVAKSPTPPVSTSARGAQVAPAPTVRTPPTP